MSATEFAACSGPNTYLANCTRRISKWGCSLGEYFKVFRMDKDPLTLLPGDLLHDPKTFQVT